MKIRLLNLQEQSDECLHLWIRLPPLLRRYRLSAAPSARLAGTASAQSSAIAR